MRRNAVNVKAILWPIFQGPKDKPVVTTPSMDKHFLKEGIDFLLPCSLSLVAMAAHERARSSAWIERLPSKFC